LAKDVLTPPEGVDLILGDHVHVVQPCEKIGDRYVTYGMGNFLSNQSPTQDRTLKDDNQDGSLQRFTVTETAPGQFKVTKMEYQPTWVVYPGHIVTPATPTNFKKSYDRTVANINLLGPGACDATPLS
jgi:poly-gamma-glutamate synthesis protein (capsule biosynthesis protein)